MLFRSLVTPSQYGEVLDELKRADGKLSQETRYRLAREAFRRTAQYDAAIAAYLRSPEATSRPAAPDETAFPPILRLEAELVQSLRYGENPHQAAAFYRLIGAPRLGVAGARQLHGPDLSYNNLLDLSAALALLLEFTGPSAVVIKHMNPCGAATGTTVAEAMRRADRKSTRLNSSHIQKSRMPSSA